MKNVEANNFEDLDDMGGHIKELTSCGVDVVIDCVGMDWKLNALEKVGQKLKLHGGTLNAMASMVLYTTCSH